MNKYEINIGQDGSKTLNYQCGPPTVLKRRWRPCCRGARP